MKIYLKVVGIGKGQDETGASNILIDMHIGDGYGTVHKKFMIEAEANFTGTCAYTTELIYTFINPLLEKKFIDNLYEGRAHIILESKNTWILGSGAIDVHMSFNHSDNTSQHSEVLLRFRNCKGYSTIVDTIDFTSESNWIAQPNKHSFPFNSYMQKTIILN